MPEDFNIPRCQEYKDEIATVRVVVLCQDGLIGIDKRCYFDVYKSWSWTGVAQEFYIAWMLPEPYKE